MGLDASSTGTVIAWLMETYEKGLLRDEDLSGVKPDWGNEGAMVEILHKIVRRDGVGGLLADGTRAAAERVGCDSHQWAVQAKGLEITALELRAAYSYALAFAVNSRGPDHLLSETIAEFGGTPEARAVMRKITGNEKYIGGTVLEKRAEIVRWHEDIYAVSDSLGLCVFTTTAAYGIDEETSALLFQHATGIEMTPEGIMEAGRRIVTLERCFNMREGLGRKDDILPWRFMHEYQEDLESVEDPILSQEKLDSMLDEYYRLHGWDRESGRPTEATLRRLGLGFVVEGS
jgi:aldehyde:ferredoxin oxidoreductase